MAKFLIIGVLFLFWVPFLMAQDVLSVSPNMDCFVLQFDRVTDPNLDHYVVHFGPVRDSLAFSVSIQDTAVQIFVPDSLVADSIFCYVTSVDDSGNVSAPSQMIAFVPAVVQMDYYFDDNNRIDLEDFRTFLRLYREHHNRTIWRYVE